MADSFAHIVVSGLVQGVGYRYFAAKAADDLGVKGYVRNLADGRVEILAGGGKGRVAEFVALLRIGPRASRVREVTLEWVQSAELFDRFEIR